MKRRQSEPVIGWVTETYSSVLMLIVGAVLVACVATFFTFPQQSHVALDKAQSLISKLVDRISGATQTVDNDERGEQQANFTALEGNVRVKKHSGNTWTAANFNLPLDKGDVVQTGSDGIAKIVFADGTNYVVKQDSLIIIEENSMNNSQQTSVAVQVTTGTVDLATATFTEGSKSQVIVAGAKATFSPETAAQVRNDPHVDKHEILVRKGSGEVARNGETLKLNDFERVSFNQEQAKMTKTKEIGPPVLISPANMLPVFTASNPHGLDFSWTPMPGSKGYRLRISRNPYFSSTVFDKVVPTTSVQLPQLDEGAYYWVVQTIDGNGRESVESDKNRFTVITKRVDSADVALELDPFIQHGHVLEIRGKTETTARVMVNGEEVPVISQDGSFRFFTHAMPNGENLITITAQNARGGVNTKQQRVVIQ